MSNEKFSFLHKKKSSNAFRWNSLVGAEGFEPPTLCL